MKQVLKDIQTGEYAKSFILENRAGAPTLLSRRRLTAEHPIEVVGEKLRAMMPWIKKNKLVDQIAQLSASRAAARPPRAAFSGARIAAVHSRPCTTPTTTTDDAADGAVARKRRKGIYILPNLFTLAALFGGFYAIVMAMNGRFEQAADRRLLRDGARQPRRPRRAHDQHAERVRRADGLAVRHGVASAPRRR